MASNIVTIKDFSKAFSDNLVISQLSFDVKKGEIFALLGANGSGKTTTLRCLLGIYLADSGQLEIAGKKYTPEDSQMLGYLPEERGLYLNSRVLDTLVYFAKLKGVASVEAQQRAEAYLQRVGLIDKAAAKIKSLSSGQQQKIQIGTAVINNPQLLILDEPTKGLDPVNRQLLLDLLAEHNKRGATIIFSTHVMEEVEEIADRLVMIKDGQRRLYGKTGDVKSDFGQNSVRIKFEGKLPKSILYSSQATKHSAELTPKTGVSQDQILSLLANDKHISLTSFEVSSPSLREIFMKIHGEESR